MSPSCHGGSQPDHPLAVMVARPCLALFTAASRVAPQQPSPACEYWLGVFESSLFFFMIFMFFTHELAFAGKGKSTVILYLSSSSSVCLFRGKPWPAFSFFQVILFFVRLGNSRSGQLALQWEGASFQPIFVSMTSRSRTGPCLGGGKRTI